MKYLWIVALLTLAGCASWIGPDEQAMQDMETVKAGAKILDPLTGGMATPIATGAGSILATIFAVNRAIVARKRGHVIREIDSNPETPAAQDQIATGKSQKVVIQIVGAKTENLKIPDPPAENIQ